MWTGRAAGDASFRSVHFFWLEAGASPPPWGRGGRHVASQDCALVSFLPAFWGTVCPSASLGLVTSAVLCSRPRESDLLDNYHFIFHHGHPLGTALSDPLCFFSDDLRMALCNPWSSVVRPQRYSGQQMAPLSVLMPCDLGPGGFLLEVGAA